MSAKVKPDPIVGWIGYCIECHESCAGRIAHVDLWADVHNDVNHRDEPAL